MVSDISKYDIYLHVVNKNFLDQKQKYKWLCGSMQQPYANIYLLYVSPNGYRPQSYL